MKIVTCRTSLVVLSLRICLPLQGTQVWSLDQEDPTCCGQLSPGTTTAEPECPRAEMCSEKPQAAQEPQPESSPRSLQLEKAHGATKTQGSQSKLTNYKNSLLILVIYLWPSHVACGILVLQPGIEPWPSVVKGQGVSHWTAREFPWIY